MRSLASLCQNHCNVGSFLSELFTFRFLWQNLSLVDFCMPKSNPSSLLYLRIVPLLVSLSQSFHCRVLYVRVVSLLASLFQNHSIFRFSLFGWLLCIIIVILLAYLCWNRAIDSRIFPMLASLFQNHSIAGLSMSESFPFWLQYNRIILCLASLFQNRTLIGCSMSESFPCWLFYARIIILWDFLC